jgi:hypothetical protein
MGLSETGEMWFFLPVAARVQIQVYGPDGRLEWKYRELGAAGYQTLSLPPVKTVKPGAILEFRIGEYRKIFRMGG